MFHHGMSVNAVVIWSAIEECPACEACLDMGSLVIHIHDHVFLSHTHAENLIHASISIRLDYCSAVFTRVTKAVT